MLPSNTGDMLPRHIGDTCYLAIIDMLLSNTRDMLPSNRGDMLPSNTRDMLPRHIGDMLPRHIGDTCYLATYSCKKIYSRISQCITTKYCRTKIIRNTRATTSTLQAGFSNIQSMLIVVVSMQVKSQCSVCFFHGAMIIIVLLSKRGDMLPCNKGAVHSLSSRYVTNYIPQL